MQIIEVEDRKKPFVTDETHARLKHDYAYWPQDPKHKKQCDLYLKASKKGRLPYQDNQKSKFNSAVIIDEAILKSYKHPGIVSKIKKKNRTEVRHVISFDMGYEVGYDVAKGRNTSCVTVVTKENGEVVTVYPGMPGTKEYKKGFVYKPRRWKNHSEPGKIDRGDRSR